jgi:NADH dehydrogenase
MNIAVTGAFGYSGRYIARHLLDGGHRVVTLTNSHRRENPFGDAVQAIPFHFDDPPMLTESLKGVDALINTYWVRFDHPPLFTIDRAVANSKILFQAAKDAGVRRIVHISITHPDIHSRLPYFRGKAELEIALQSLGVSHCILRPTVLFGKEDILINNMAWGLRHLPVFAVFGSGHYRLQPIYVDDLAAVAAERATAEGGNEIIEAIGPETFTYRQLVNMLARKLGVHRPIVSLPPGIAYWACKLFGLFVNDVIVTRDEIQGLMEERLYVEAPALGATRLSEWVDEHKDALGRRYTSEIARRTDRVSKYSSN